MRLEANILVEPLGAGVVALYFQAEPTDAEGRTGGYGEFNRLPADAPAAERLAQVELIEKAVIAAGLDGEADGDGHVAGGLAVDLDDPDPDVVVRRERPVQRGGDDRVIRRVAVIGVILTNHRVEDRPILGRG